MRGGAEFRRRVIERFIARLAPWRKSLVALVRLAVPVIGARLGIMTMGLTDVIVVGHYSAHELAYQALGWAPTGVVITATVGLLSGIQVMTARRIGEGRAGQAGAVLRRGLTYAFWIGAISTALLVAAGPGLLRVLGLGDELAEGAGRVLRVLALSLTPYAMSVALSSYLEATNRPMPGLIAMWLANAVNLALNLWLVRGGFGVPALGAVGASIGTFGSRLALLVALAVYIARHPASKAHGVFDKPATDRPAAIEQRRIGYGAGASYFVEAAAFSGMNIVAGWLGPLPVAAWSVILNVSAVVFMLPLGLSAATAVLVGQAYGARDPAGVVRAAWTGFGVSTVMGLVVTVLIGVFPGVVARAYATDAALIAMTIPALAFTVLFFVPDGLQTVAAQALRARGDIVVPTVTHIVSYAAVMLPLGWWLAHRAHMGLFGIVWSVLLSSILASGLLIGRFVWLSRVDRS